MAVTKGRKIVTWGYAVILALLTFQMCGCGALLIGAAGGAGAVAWVKGEMKEEIDKPLDEVYAATGEALKELELPGAIEKKNALTAKIKSSFADRKDVVIVIKSLSGTSSEISIRIGMVGDRARSQKILNTIHKHLESEKAEVSRFVQPTINPAPSGRTGAT